MSLRTVADDTGSILEVADTGIGIPTSAIPHVFDRFFRVDEARSREDGGAGLGLAIVKAIAEMHRGTVAVESAVGINTFAFSVDASRFDVQGVRELIRLCEEVEIVGPPALRDRLTATLATMTSRHVSRNTNRPRAASR